MIGPALVKQDTLEAQSNVNKRLEFIGGALPPRAAGFSTPFHQRSMRASCVLTPWAVTPAKAAAACACMRASPRGCPAGSCWSPAPPPPCRRAEAAGQPAAAAGGEAAEEAGAGGLRDGARHGTAAPQTLLPVPRAIQRQQPLACSGPQSARHLKCGVSTGCCRAPPPACPPCLQLVKLQTDLQRAQQQAGMVPEQQAGLAAA